MEAVALGLERASKVAPARPINHVNAAQRVGLSILASVIFDGSHKKTFWRKLRWIKLFIEAHAICRPICRISDGYVHRLSTK